MQLFESIPMNNNQEDQQIQRIIYSPMTNQNEQQVYYVQQQSSQQIFYQIQNQRDQQQALNGQNSQQKVNLLLICSTKILTFLRLNPVD